MTIDGPVVITAVIFSFPALLLLAARHVQRRAERDRTAAAYREAAAIGLATVRVDRDLPVFERANTRVRFVPGSCARSAVPLRRGGSAGPATWSFRVHHRRGALAGDGWWHLREDDGELPQEVVDLLHREIARIEPDGGFIEFAGNRVEVIAWWDEAAGPEEARRVAAALRDVARFLDRRSFTPRSMSAVAS